MFSPGYPVKTPNFTMPYSSRVVALFKNGARTFLLREGATFTDLADGIESLGERNQGEPISIHVLFDYPDMRSMHQTAIN